jgi:hypothetical protein
MKNQYRLWFCGCCQPPRQLYIRLAKSSDTLHHEADDSPALPHETARAARKRRSEAARKAGRQCIT